MKGGTSLFDLVAGLHANQFLPGSGFDLTPEEVVESTRELEARLRDWTPSCPGCEAFDGFVLALAHQVLADLRGGAPPEVFVPCADAATPPPRVLPNKPGAWWARHGQIGPLTVVDVEADEEGALWMVDSPTARWKVTLPQITWVCPILPPEECGRLICEAEGWRADYLRVVQQKNREYTGRLRAEAERDALRVRLEALRKEVDQGRGAPAGTTEPTGATGSAGKEGAC